MQEPEITEEEGSVASTLMAQLRERHQELATSTTIDIPIPGYEDLLVAKYRVLDVKNEINRISQSVARSSGKSQLARALNAALDTLAVACVEIYAVKGEELHPLSEAVGSVVPVRYDEQLAEFVGLKASGARETILQLFGANEPMIMEHAQTLSRWMSNTRRGVNEDFLGEL